MAERCTCEYEHVGRTDDNDCPVHGPPMADERMTIIVELPARLGAVGELLEVVGKHWPDSVVDTNHPEGWRITLKADDG